MVVHCFITQNYYSVDGYMDYIIFSVIISSIINILVHFFFFADIIQVFLQSKFLE